MGLEKVSLGVTERIAPLRGPTSSADYNASMEEIRNSFSQLSSIWNTQLQPLLDSLPSGKKQINRDQRTSNPNPFINGFDGSQIYTDLTSLPYIEEGKFYNPDEKRPFTIKESLLNMQSQLNSRLQDLEVKISEIGKEAGITSRQKQAIGFRIFDPSTESSPTSLDGKVSALDRNITQLGLDISGNPNYLNNSGNQTLLYSILEQLEAIKDAHSYDSNFNTMSHGNLPFRIPRYHIVPNGALDGVNRDYFIPANEKFITGSLRVIINGVEQPQNITYIEHPNNQGFSITLERLPLENDGSGADDRLWVHYDINMEGDL